MRNILFVRYNQEAENALTYEIDSFYLSIRKVEKNHLAFAFDESDRERAILGLYELIARFALLFHPRA